MHSWVSNCAFQIQTVCDATPPAGAHDGLHHRALQVHVPPPLPQHLAVHGDGGGVDPSARLLARVLLRPREPLFDHVVYTRNAIEVVVQLSFARSFVRSCIFVLFALFALFVLFARFDFDVRRSLITEVYTCQYTHGVPVRALWFTRGVPRGFAVGWKRRAPF